MITTSLDDIMNHEFSTISVNVCCCCMIMQIPPGANKDDVVRQLETFKKLLMNKKFIHTMVKTLEGNPQKFGIPDRYS